MKLDKGAKPPNNPYQTIEGGIWQHIIETTHTTYKKSYDRKPLRLNNMPPMFKLVEVI